MSYELCMPVRSVCPDNYRGYSFSARGRVGGSYELCVSMGMLTGETLS